MFYIQKSCVANNVIDLFNKNEYEKIILNIINSSNVVFPEKYEYIKEQSNGECDYISSMSKAKYDAKLPFLPEQIKMLTDGKKHKPQIQEWLDQMNKEALEFKPHKIQNNPDEAITKAILYQIMKKSICKDKPDENIIFFIPYPIVASLPEFGFINDFPNFLSRIYDSLKQEIELNNRNIFVIYPSLKKNIYALRNLTSRKIEFLECNNLEKYISFTVPHVL